MQAPTGTTVGDLSTLLEMAEAASRTASRAVALLHAACAMVALSAIGSAQGGAWYDEQAPDVCPQPAGVLFQRLPSLTAKLGAHRRSLKEPTRNGNARRGAPEARSTQTAHRGVSCNRRS